MLTCSAPARCGPAGLTMATRHPHNRWVNPSTRDHGHTAGPGTLHEELRAFEIRLGELLMLMTQLQEENRALRQRLDVLTTERTSLLQKNEQVRTRVEAMIGRLKAMEHGA
jgi:cell division protein ZapB